MQCRLEIMTTKYRKLNILFSKKNVFAFLILILLLPFAVCLASEKNKRAKNADETPEEVVRQMLKALKNSEWEKAVSYIDIQGIISEAKVFLNDASKQLSADEKEELKKEIENLTEEKVRESFIANMKEVFGNDFSFVIKGKSMRDEDKAVIFVELSRNGKSKNDSIPLVKINEKWLVSYRSLVKFTPAGTK